MCSAKVYRLAFFSLGYDFLQFRMTPIMLQLQNVKSRVEWVS